MGARQGNFSCRWCAPIASIARQGCTSDVKDQFSWGDEHARGSGDLQELGRHSAFSPRNGVRVAVLDAPLVNAANPRAPLWCEWTVCQDAGGLARSVCQVDRQLEDLVGTIMHSLNLEPKQRG